MTALSMSTVSTEQQKAPHILLLEDAAWDIELIQANLKEGGIDYTFVCVDNREAFLAELEDCKFDLILADYSLPDFNGLEALRLAIARCPEIPFILISGVLGEELAIETLKSGAIDYVLKQRIERLGPAVHRALQEARARSQRRQMEQELQQREQQFRALAENSPDIVARFDRELRHVYVNRAVTEVTGQSAHSFIGKTNAELGMSAELSQRWEQAIQQVFDSGEPQCIEFDFPALDGLMRHYQSHLVPEFAPDGSVAFVLGVSRDITERQHSLLREQAARADAEAANRVKDEFLAVLSHELRSPLNAILGWASLLRRGSLDATVAQNAIEIIERNARLQTQLIGDLLDVSRILRGKTQLHVRSLNLIEVVEAATHSMQLAIEAKALALQIVIEPAMVRVLGDPDRLQQILWNLLSNAVKFTASGGQITIRVSLEGAIAKIVVQDTGKGISAEFLPHVFEYFRQADASTTRAQGGLGLGLAIVRHLVELHGGRVYAASPGEGQGSTFTVTLPLAPAEPPPASPPATDVPDQLDLGGLRVLVVDDEADARDMLTFILKQHGAKVIAVDSTQAALQQLEQTPLDVLVSDIGMPHESGYALAQQVQARRGSRDKKLLAIALTAYATPEDERQAIAAGFDLHFPKPIEPDALLAAIAQLTT